MQSTSKFAKITLEKTKQSNSVFSHQTAKYSTKHVVGTYAPNVGLRESSKNVLVRNMKNELVPVSKETGHWKRYNPKTHKVTHTFSSSSEFPEGNKAFCLDPDERLDGTKQPQYLIENQIVTDVPPSGFIIDCEKTKKFHQMYSHKPEVKKYLKDGENKNKQTVYMDFIDKNSKK